MQTMLHQAYLFHYSTVKTGTTCVHYHREAVREPQNYPRNTKNSSIALRNEVYSNFQCVNKDQWTEGQVG